MQLVSNANAKKVHAAPNEQKAASQRRQNSTEASAADSGTKAKANLTFHASRNERSERLRPAATNA